MSIDNTTYDRIDNYLSGKMSKDDLNRFEQDMASDVNLTEEVNAMRFANQSLLDYKIASIYTMMEARNPYTNTTESSTTTDNKILKWVGGALVASGIIFGIHYLSSENEIDSNPEMVSVNEETVIERGPHMSNDSEIEGAQEQTPHIDTTSKESVSLLSKDQVLVGEDQVETVLDEVVYARKDSLLNEGKTDSAIVQPIDICDGVKIKAEPLPVKTCIGKSEGEIFIPRTKINGGTYPYEFSLNDRVNYSKKNAFGYLDIGEYRVFIRDANGCQSVPVLVTIEGKRCDELEGESFNPTIALWEFPVDDYEYCQIEVVNVSGRMVYKIRMDGDEAPRWDGRSLSGSDLASDIYVYQIKYDDGRLEKGYINLVR